MVERLQDFNLIEQQFRLFDVLLGDFFDGSPLRAVLFLAFVYDSIGAFSEFLNGRCGTLGLMS